ncbi:winged helix-turn-helix domain-containing protein [Kitasatospora sp. NPDC048286]|uniref:winged helix-turn-helix domain-containing protein n=1 Tax=Kitasatospora sp. NPDC048286 TaxID=3364047 RepID=UPI003724C23C
MRIRCARAWSAAAPHGPARPGRITRSPRSADRVRPVESPRRSSINSLRRHRHLCFQAEKVVTRAELTERRWDGLAEPQSNVVDVLMSQVRRKLGTPPLIDTVRGAGFRLTGTDGPR